MSFADVGDFACASYFSSDVKIKLYFVFHSLIRIFVPIISKPNNMKRLILTMLVGLSVTAQAQKVLYPRHFDLLEVTLTDGPMKKALDLNCEVLMQYDVDRLLTPFVRQSGLASTSDKTSRYYQWLTKHPNFPNWGGSGFDLSGHVGGHYLSALALAYAACHDASMKARLKES